MGTSSGSALKKMFKECYLGQNSYHAENVKVFLVVPTGIHCTANDRNVRMIQQKRIITLISRLEKGLC